MPGGNVLYVGKAKDLRSRVRSYFRESRPHDGRMRIMIRKIEDVEVIVTDTEAEALILENNLIKHLKPRYNVLLRDDKTFPFIAFETNGSLASSPRAALCGTGRNTSARIPT